MQLDTTLSNLTSPIRWAGSKRWFTKYINDFTPDVYERIVDPMVGAGSLIFNLKPQNGLIGDLNPELINFYQVLRDHTDKLLARLSPLKASEALYYQLRAQKPRTPLNRAIRFVYLNRLCFNGIYRVNRSGQFNTPYGKREPDNLWDLHQLAECAEVLSNCDIIEADFESTINRVELGDFVILDPPYSKTLNTVGFNRYNQKFFDLKEHHRLSLTLDILDQKGAFYLLFIGNSEMIRRIYPKSSNQCSMPTQSLISGKAKGRQLINETIIKNY